MDEPQIVSSAPVYIQTSSGNRPQSFHRLFGPTMASRFGRETLNKRKQRLRGYNVSLQEIEFCKLLKFCKASPSAGNWNSPYVPAGVLRDGARCECSMSTAKNSFALWPVPSHIFPSKFFPLDGYPQTGPSTTFCANQRDFQAKS